ncbi:hypothetical protein AB0K02_14765 [Streptomyces sp. NPDC049597]|uniref:hypothetical protein n=1 Tax=Streptomyces sp. NPDC049597 TaxID=3155276 RepID=UPI00343A6EAB
MVGNGANKIAAGPKEYLPGHFNAMREFYRGATERQLLWGSGETDTDGLTVGSPQQQGNYMSVRNGVVPCFL